MILITHHNNRVVQIENQSIPVAGINDNGVLAAIFQLAKEYPNDLIVWVEKQYRSSLNLEYFRKNDIPDNMKGYVQVAIQLSLLNVKFDVVNNPFNVTPQLTAIFTPGYSVTRAEYALTAGRLFGQYFQ